MTERLALDTAPLPVKLRVEDYLLLDESDESGAFDADASASVPEYWVVDVNAKVIHQMWAPEDKAYAKRWGIAFGQAIDATTIEGLSIATAQL